MFILRDFEYVFVPEFLEHFLRSPFAREQIENNQSGSAQPQLPITDFRKFIAPVPSKAEQLAIVEIIKEGLNGVTELIKYQKSITSFLNQFNESVLEKAFTGELVSQHPDDESAKKLLKRKNINI